MSHRSAVHSLPSRALRFVGVVSILVLAGTAIGWQAGLVDLTGATNHDPAAEPSPTPAQTQATEAPATPEPSPSPTPTPRPTSTPEPSPSPTPTPTPVPTPVLVPAPLTGRLVSPEVAEQHVIGLMIDDHHDARPQAGLSEADVVWHAPAEGGIPRYLALYQSQMPTLVGPVRSARHYYIAWAAEWQALYVHSGGSPQALATLRESGNGQLVYNADEFRYGGRYLYRSRDRFAPHNIYTNGERLRALADVVGATDGPIVPAWRFGHGAPPEARPTGGRIVVEYAANDVRYDYDHKTNRYLRSVTGESREVDTGTGARVSPKNVVILVMSFAPLRGDAHPEKGRLEADVVGSGTAWIASNGVTRKATWRKASLSAPTLLLDEAGEPVELVTGQTFIQVVPSAATVTIEDGRVSSPPRPTGRFGESIQ